MAWAVRWPLLVVYPCSAAFFWLMYLLALPALSRRLLPVRYGQFNAFNERCWRQNINSLVHTSVAVVLLCALRPRHGLGVNMQVWQREYAWSDPYSSPTSHA